SGGFGAFAFPSGTLTGSAKVTTDVEAASLAAGGSVSITADSATNYSSYGDTTSAGAIADGKANASTDVSTAPTLATVGAAKLVAGAHSPLSAASDHTIPATASSKGGGSTSGKVAFTKAAIASSTKPSIGAGAEITAGGAVLVHSTSTVTGRTEA